MTINIKLLILFFLISIQTARAENFPCLLDTKNKTIKWNAGWQSDNQDNKVIYNIKDVTEDAQNNLTTLELTAITNANKNTRKIVVNDSLFAQTLCDKIQSENEKENKIITQNDKLKETLYIKYSKNSWVFAEAPQNETLASCFIYSKKYLCSLRDKLSHQNDLKKIEEELKLEVD